MTRFVRNPVVTETLLDSDVFLVEPHSDEVFYLDTVSGGLWRLLAEATSLDDLQAAYRAAFPEADGTVIDADIASAIEDMKARGLIVAYD